MKKFLYWKKLADTIQRNIVQGFQLLIFALMQTDWTKVGWASSLIQREWLLNKVLIMQQIFI